MLYKPKYCCNCGEEIERTNWSFLTSRRFCEICEIDFKGQEMLPKIGTVLMLLIGVFGVGSYLMAEKKPAELKPGKITEITSGTRNTTENQKNLPESQKNSPANVANTAVPMQTETGSPVQPLTLTSQPGPQNISPNGALKTSEIPAADNEPVYFCGAATKKGTACTRRVKGGGRCWQHKGQPALVAQEKLRIQ